MIIEYSTVAPMKTTNTTLIVSMNQVTDYTYVLHFQTDIIA
jgi:hypothetical protein